MPAGLRLLLLHALRIEHALPVLVDADGGVVLRDDILPAFFLRAAGQREQRCRHRAGHRQLPAHHGTMHAAWRIPMPSPMPPRRKN
jgi:hypothetical protein